MRNRIGKIPRNGKGEAGGKGVAYQITELQQIYRWNERIREIRNKKKGKGVRDDNF